MHAGGAHDFALEGDRDLLLDLLGGETRDLGDHLGADVGDVGIGLDGQLLPAIPAIEGDEDEHKPDDAAPVEA